MSDAEVITTVLVAARFFGSNHHSAQDYLKEHGLLPKMLDQSRFNRRLPRLFLPLLDLFDYLASVLKSLNSSSEYLLDSFPVALCDNIRIPQARWVRSEDCGLNALPLNLPSDSEVYADAAYTDYQAEDNLTLTDSIRLHVARKSNSTRPDSPALLHQADHPTSD